MDEEASKNKKNTATLSNDTILTSRLGCLARTLAANNCTDKEIAIRLAMSTSNETNCNSPDSESVGLAFRSRTPSFLSSPVATRKVLGKAVNTIDKMSTEATSSSSDICASLAADSSSCPMPKETLNARSEPREPRAVAASAMSGVVNFNSCCVKVNYETLEEAVFESRTLSARLAWQRACEGGAQLVLRRLLIAPVGTRNGSLRRYEPYSHPSQPTSQPTRIRNKGYEESMASAGCVFGCTFGNLMHHCRAEKHSLHSCMVQMRRVLKAGGKAVIKSSGEDRVFLAQGMGMHRVMKAQARHFPELRTCKRIDSKAGHIGIVFGAAASILIAFECMSGSTGDLPGLTHQLGACLRDAVGALVHWDMSETTDDDILSSKAAECRALQRAQAGVLRAQHLARENKLDETKAMRLQLDCFRRALWPSGEEVGENTHVVLMERIRSGELVDLEIDAEAGGLNAPGVASLSALSSLPRRMGGGGGGGSTESGGSSISGSRSWSSWASFAGRDAGEPEGPPAAALSGVGGLGGLGGTTGLGGTAGLAHLGALALKDQPSRDALAAKLNPVKTVRE